MSNTTTQSPEYSHRQNISLDQSVPSLKMGSASSALSQRTNEHPNLCSEVSCDNESASTPTTEMEYDDDVYENDTVQTKWKDNTTSTWIILRKNKVNTLKSSFYLDRSCKVKQDLRSKQNGLFDSI